MSQRFGSFTETLETKICEHYCKSSFQQAHKLTDLQVSQKRKKLHSKELTHVMDFTVHSSHRNISFL